MRCLKCNRALTRYTLETETSDGTKGWGPSCAKKTGLIAERVRERSAPAVRRDLRTRDWVNELGAQP